MFCWGAIRKNHLSFSTTAVYIFMVRTCIRTVLGVQKDLRCSKINTLNASAQSIFFFSFSHPSASELEYCKAANWNENLAFQFFGNIKKKVRNWKAGSQLKKDGVLIYSWFLILDSWFLMEFGVFILEFKFWWFSSWRYSMSIGRATTDML